MTRAKGQVVARVGATGTSYGLRFHLGGVRHYVTADATTADGARAELDAILGAASLGLWTPPVAPAKVARPGPEDEPPSFGAFASTWLDGRRHEIRPRTLESLSWQIETHLRPAFGNTRIDRIGIADVDGFKTGKLRARERDGAGLGNGSINRCLTTLASVLDAATEAGYRSGDNPARGKRRRLKQDRPRRSYLEVDQANALLDAASDPEHAALIATMMCGGLRVGEATALRWRDVNLGAGKLTIRHAKTSAGVREPEIPASLHDRLAEHKATTADTAADAFVFRTRNGTPRDRRNASKNVLLPAVKRANAALEQAGKEPIAHCSPHTLRHTFITIAVAAGASVPWLMRQVGHTSPVMTLGVYAHPLAHDDGALAAFDGLLGGAPAVQAQPGTNSENGQLEQELAELLADD